jgi:hypothetical protein
VAKCFDSGDVVFLSLRSMCIQTRYLEVAGWFRSFGGKLNEAWGRNLHSMIISWRRLRTGAQAKKKGGSYRVLGRVWLELVNTADVRWWMVFYKIPLRQKSWVQIFFLKQKMAESFWRLGLYKRNIQRRPLWRCYPPQEGHSSSCRTFLVGQQGI